LNTTVFATLGDTDSGTGPTINEGQMMGFSFSKCIVNSLPEGGECSESKEEKLDGRLGGANLLPGDTERDDAISNGSLRRTGSPVLPELITACASSDGEPGGDVLLSSDSETCPLANDAAKLLEMSGSEETNA